MSRLHSTAVQNKVVAACETEWEAHKSDCSGFVRAVAKDLGITMEGMANEIVDQMQRSPWTLLKTPAEASKKAESAFVLAGLKANGHGHVVVIVPGPGVHPMGYWGRLGGVGKKNASINWAWTKEDLGQVIYAWRPYF